MNYDDLKKLDDLRRTGAISEEEYQKEKDRFFNRPENAQPAGSNPLWGMSENSYIALMHISQLTGIIVPGLGFIAPVVLWAINKEANPQVNTVGRHIINFMVSMLIYYAVSVILCILLIGIPMLIALGIMHIVFVIIAAIKANNGEPWKYPLTIEFLK